MKQIATVRMTEAVSKYGEQAPMTAVCCNACRTCVTTNLVGLATMVFAGSITALTRIARRVIRAAPQP
jgi:hypothetical protein